MNQGSAQNGLLICPDCLSNGYKYILGSITPSGDFEVLRFSVNKRITTIRSSQLTVICTCGFGTTINNGNVTYLNDNN